MSKFNSKKTLIIENKGKVIYQNNELQVKVVQEQDGSLFFESHNHSLSECFMTHDFAEAVAAFMRIKELINDKEFWRIKVDSNTAYDITPAKTFYWLTGGNKEWKGHNHFKYDWSEVNSYYTDKYSEAFYKILEESITLEDIRNRFIINFNLPVLYEFALINDLII
jgi:hypothetical protein